MNTSYRIDVIGQTRGGLHGSYSKPFVLCVNAHDRLVKACKQACVTLAMVPAKREPSVGYLVQLQECSIVPMLEGLHAALAAAQP